MSFGLGSGLGMAFYSGIVTLLGMFAVVSANKESAWKPSSVTIPLKNAIPRPLPSPIRNPKDTGNERFRSGY